MKPGMGAYACGPSTQEDGESKDNLEYIVLFCFLSLFLFYVHGYCAYMYVCESHMSSCAVHVEPRRGCQVPGWSWDAVWVTELNSDSLKEQQILTAAEPHLRPSYTASLKPIGILKALLKGTGSWTWWKTEASRSLCIWSHPALHSEGFYKRKKGHSVSSLLLRPPHTWMMLPPLEVFAHIECCSGL